MQRAPIVSVIVPCHNYGRFVGEAVNSVQAQTYRSWECIVVDDASDDNTREIVSRLSASDDRVKYVHQPGGGVSCARNVGLQISRGEWIQFLDADDLIEARKFEKQISFLQSAPHVDVTYGEGRYFTGQDSDKLRYGMVENDDRWMPKLSGSGTDIVREFMLRNVMMVNAPLIRYSAFRNVGGFDMELRGVEDWDLWTRLAMAGRYFAYHDCDGARALVRVHSQSATNDWRRMCYGALTVAMRISRMNKDDSLTSAVEALRYRTHSEIVWRELHDGSISRGILELFKMFRRGLSLSWAARCLARAAATRLGVIRGAREI